MATFRAFRRARTTRVDATQGDALGVLPAKMRFGGGSGIQQAGYKFVHGARRRRRRARMPKEKTHPTEYFVAGGLAGVVSRTCIAPIERVKILYQVTSRNAGGNSLPWTAIAPKILREEGLAAFWKGNTAAVVRVVPYMSMTFLTYEEYKANLVELGVPKQASTLTAGSLAGVTAVVLTYPLDLARATMAMPTSTHASMIDAVGAIARERGVGALYSGVSATCIGVAPYAGLKFLSYEALKGVLGTIFGVEEAQLKPWQRVASGMLAGMLAQTLIYPLDVVRRRMQTSTGVLYTSTWDALSTIARNEGLSSGLYRGLTLNYLKTSPSDSASHPLASPSRVPRSDSCSPRPPDLDAWELRHVLTHSLAVESRALLAVPNVAIYMSLYDIVKIRLRRLDSSSAERR